MSKFLGFPGYIDLAVLSVLAFLYLSPDIPLTLAVTVAVIRVLFAVLFFRKYIYFSSRGLTYNLILFALAAGYLLIGGHGWRAAVTTYLGVGGLTEILFIICAELRSRIRSSRG
ncbi:hypothetical protein ACA097_08455 [Pseudomonas sp. QL9]|uniref:hypothetical protein n=1 Tax=Pseudomonas sp. QL9 TaxID=3242725 RepID=UPI00352A4559